MGLKTEEDNAKAVVGERDNTIQNLRPEKSVKKRVKFYFKASEIKGLLHRL
jgi:spore coat polysaccharide biosynthesis predicted glycosyltransferase SpsG